MNIIFIDAGYLIALLNPADDLHAGAIEIAATLIRN